MIRENEGAYLEYEAQRLREMDDRVRLRQSLEEGLARGREEGRQLGALVGRIRTLQEILGISVSSENALYQQPVEELTRLADDLASRVRQR